VQDVDKISLEATDNGTIELFKEKYWKEECLKIKHFYVDTEIQIAY